MAEKEKAKMIRTPEALRIAEDRGVDTSLPTLIRWCREHKIGRQMGTKGKWYVDKARLIAFLEGRREQGQ